MMLKSPQNLPYLIKGLMFRIYFWFNKVTWSRLKEFRLLNNIIPIFMLNLCDNIYGLSGSITNMQPPLIVKQDREYGSDCLPEDKL